MVIEAGVRAGWEGFIGVNGLFFGMDEFGHSAPYQTLYEHFGLTAENVVARVLEKV